MGKSGRRRLKARKSEEDSGFDGTAIDLVAALLANALALAVLGVAWYLAGTESALYGQLSQEDGALEWASFLAFLLAAALFTVAAIRQRRGTGVVPWFLSGLGLFCFFVAMEEISWGQRLLDYRPPVYFLEQNFQQELNLHNIVPKGLRQLAVFLILLGYGVLFPLIARIRAVRSVLMQLAIVPPALVLSPIFLVTSLVYLVYPWRFTGEWVELSMGLGFLFAALPAVGAWRPAGPLSAGAQRIQVAALWLAILLGGALLVAVTEWLQGDDSRRVASARAEVQALARDFRLVGSVCQRYRSVSKRVYTYAEEYGDGGLSRGQFAALAESGLPQERARYFLDPWNAPYWMRCLREGSREFVMVYSFGPNGRRDSAERELLGDDIGQDFLVIRIPQKGN